MAEKNKVDWVARIISILSLVVALTSLFFTTLRPASIKIGIGNFVLVKDKPLIGVLCTFSNEGARQAIITSATITWNNSPVNFELSMISPSLEQWEYKKGIQEMTSATKYTLVAPIAVKGHDQATAILWFSSQHDFSFTPGNHGCTLKIFSQSDVLAQIDFEVPLTDSEIESIRKNPAVEFAIKIKPSN